MINFVKLEKSSDRICHSKETGGKTMKKVARLLGFLLVLGAALAVGFAGVSEAYTPYASESVGVSATLGISDTLTVQAKNISDNGSVTSVAFGSVTNARVVAPQYVEINVGSNRNNWELDIYTDNFATAPSTTTWGTQYGGLIGATAGNCAPMLWETYDSTVSTPNTTEGAWTWFKDKHDTGDYPWLEDGVQSGYVNIAFGGPDSMTIISPTVDKNMAVMQQATSPIVVYLNGKFTSSPADSYTATNGIGFDLYYEP